MTENEETTFYEILDITSDASQQEVRDAYIRSKDTYNKDSLVLYSLIEADDREEMLKKIEEAFHVLSDPVKRREYDDHHGIISQIENPFSRPPEQRETRQESEITDSTPPMEEGSDHETLLIPPTTDFPDPGHHQQPEKEPPKVTPPSYPSQPQPVPPQPPPSVYTGPPTVPWNSRSSNSDLESFLPRMRRNTLFEISPLTKALSQKTVKSPQPEQEMSKDVANLVEEIRQQEEWAGSFLRKVRTASQISVEEMSEITKITRTYINAIEEEQFEKLPAAVYVRGFITQIAKVLKLPPDKVAAAYLVRYRAKRNTS